MIKKIFAIILLCLMVIIASCSPVPKTASLPEIVCTNYVSPSGLDSNAGTLAAPWKTIQYAANKAVGGNTVCIRAGTYTERVLLYYKTNTSFITFASYPGESAILDGTGIAIQYGEGLFHIQRTDYIRVTNLRVQNSNGAGIESSYSNHIQIDHNQTYDTVKSGISTWGGSNLVVDSNDIALACNAHPNYIASEENISIAAGSSNVVVSNNLVHQAANIGDGYSGGEGINIKDGSHDVNIFNNIVHLDERADKKPSNRLAFGLDAWSGETYNVNFYNNIAYNSGYGFIVESENGGTAHDITVHNNLAYNNVKNGFLIPTWAKNETSLKKNIQFTNNTSYNNGTGITIDSVKVENVVIRNNIFSQNKVNVSVVSGASAQTFADHNLFYGGNATGSNNILTDPLFVSISNSDFHLMSNSPAIGKASDNGDMGAFPFGTYVTTTPFVATNTIVPTGTRTNTLVVSSSTPTNVVASETNTPVPVVTNTDVPVQTVTVVPSNTFTATFTATSTATPVPTNTSTLVPTRTFTPTRTPTRTPTPTVTASPTGKVLVCKITTQYNGTVIIQCPYP